MNLTEDEAEKLNVVLAVLLKRAGGKISFSDQELADAEHERVLYDETRDVAGFTHLYLIPDYISIGSEDPPEGDRALGGTMSDEAMAKLLEEVKKLKTTTTGITSGTYPTVGVGTPVTWGWSDDPIGIVSGGAVVPNGVEFEMKMTDKGRSLWDKINQSSKSVYSIGNPQAVEYKEKPSG